METPALTLALVFFGPLLVPLHAIAGMGIVFLVGVAAVFVDGWIPGAIGLAVALAAGLVLLLARRRGWPGSWLLAIWISLACMPLVGTALSQRLAAPPQAPSPVC